MTRADNNFENRSVKITIVFSIFIVACLIVGSFFQSNFTWGFHSLGFLSLKSMIVYSIAFISGLLFIYVGRYEKMLDKVSTYMIKKPTSFLFFTIIFFVIAAILLRVKIPLLGDGFIYIKRYENIQSWSDALIVTRQPVALLFFHLFIMIFGVHTYPEIMTGFLAGELLLGIGFIIITYNIIRKISENPCDRLLGFLFALSFPYMQLYFGYVEMYAVALFTHSVFLLAIIYYFNKNGSYLLVLLSFLLLFFSNYLSAVLFLPSILYLTFKEYKLEGKKNIIVGLSLIAGITLLIMMILNFSLEPLIPRSDHSHYLTISPTNDKYQAYTLFSPYHIIDILNLLILMVAPALLLIGLTLFHSKHFFSNTPIARFLILFILCLILFISFVKYDLPMAVDWDITAPLFYVVVIYSIYVMNQARILRSPRIFGLILLVTILPSMIYFQLNASETPNVKRVKVFLDTSTASQSGFYQTAFNLSMHYMYKYDIDSLIQLWDLYVKTYPKDGDGYENLVKAYWELGEEGYSGIDETFKKWIIIDSKNTHIQSQYANICMLQGNYYYEKRNLEAASMKFKQTIELKTDIPGAYNNIGLINYELGRYDSAIHYFNIAILTDSNYVLGYKNMAKAFIAKEEYDAAIQLFKKAISLNPDLPVIYEDMAKMYDLLGKQKEAIEYYQEAARRGSITSQQNLSVLGYKW